MYQVEVAPVVRGFSLLSLLSHGLHRFFIHADIAD
jgi:hypothetical protein